MQNFTADLNFAMRARPKLTERCCLMSFGTKIHGFQPENDRKRQFSCTIVSKNVFSLLLGYAISCWKFLTQQFGFFLTHLKSIKFCFMIPPAHYSLVIASILAAVVIFLATFTRCFDWRCIEWLFRNIIKCTLFCTFYSPLRTHHKLSHLLCSSDIIF